MTHDDHLALAFIFGMVAGGFIVFAGFFLGLFIRGDR